MSDDPKLLKYSDLSAKDKLLTKEYVKSILRAKTIALISGASPHLKDINIDDSLVMLTNAIVSYEEQSLSENRLFKEVFEPFSGTVENKVLDCIGCLLKNRDINKCPGCEDVLKPPDE